MCPMASETAAEQAETTIRHALAALSGRCSPCWPRCGARRWPGSGRVRRAICSTLSYSVGCRVLLDAGNALGAGDRGDVVALCEQPGQSDLSRCGADLGGDGLDVVDDAEVLFEVALCEARVVLAPV